MVAADDNAPIKVLRLRIKDDTGGPQQGANLLQPMEGEDATCAPAGDDSTVRISSLAMLCCLGTRWLDVDGAAVQGPSR